jgi:hypothetical protein
MSRSMPHMGMVVARTLGTVNDMGGNREQTCKQDGEGWEGGWTG